MPMMPNRKQFPMVSLEAPPPVTMADFGSAPQMGAGGAPVLSPEGLSGQVNQLGQILKLGKFKPMGGVGSKAGSFNVLGKG